MSDRYGYGNGRGNRENDTYDQYGEWHSDYLGASRSSNGAGAYSKRSSNRRTVSQWSEDDAWSQSEQVPKRKSVNSKSRRSSEDMSSRSSERRSSRSPQSSAESRSSRRQAEAATEQRAMRRRAAAESDGRGSTRRQSRESATSRYSRSSYGSGGARASAASRRDSVRNAQKTHARSTDRSARSSQSSNYADEPVAKKKSGKRRNIAIVAVAVVAVLLVGAISAFAYVSSITGSLHEGVDQDLRAALVETDMANEPFYMLLMGTDKVSWREGTEDGGLYRSDSMILARIDAPNGTMTLISIPRDTLVDMGEYGWQKINAAYGLGGPSLAVEAVSKLTGVDISHYAEVDMDGLSAVVDAIGGIEVDVPVEIDDEDAGGYLAAGWQTLDGEQALILCRSRNTFIETSAAPDLMRAANQRLVLSAIAHKILDSDIATIAKTVSSAAEYVTTDLELNDIIGLAQALQGMDTDDAFYTASLPTRSAYIVNGYGYADNVSGIITETVDPTVPEGWYVILEEEEWNTMKGRMSEGLPPAEGYEVDEATGVVLSTAGSDADDISSKYAWITIMNGTDREGLATRVMGMLNADGFENITLADAPYGNSYPETLVIYDEEGRAHGAQQIVDAMGQGKAMLNDGSWVVENNFLVIIGDDWQGATSSSSSSSESTSSGGSSNA